MPPPPGEPRVKEGSFDWMESPLQQPGSGCDKPLPGSCPSSAVGEAMSSTRAPPSSAVGSGTPARREGVHWIVGPMWVAVIVALFSFLFPDTDGLLLRAIITFIAILAALLTIILYTHWFCVPQRMRAVSRSILSWQLLALFVTNAVVTVGWAGPDADSVNGRFVNVCGQVGLIGMFIITIAMDACSGTKLEVQITVCGLVVLAVVQIYGNLYLWDDQVVIANASSTAFRRNIFTKNEIRRSCFTQILNLMASASISKLWYDHKGTHYLWVMQCRVKPQFRRLDHQPAVRTTRVHWTMAVFWTLSMAYAGLAIFGDFTDDDEWFLVLLWSFVVAKFFLFAVFAWRHGNLEALLRLSQSLLACQVVCLMLVYAVVSIWKATPGYEKQAVPTSILFVLPTVIAVLLDATHTTKTESVVSLGLLTAANVGALVANIVKHEGKWADQIVFQGFRQAGTLWIGQWTRNEVKRSASLSILMLLFCTLVSSWFDKRHERMLFVKSAKMTPEAVKMLHFRLRAWLRSIARVNFMLNFQVTGQLVEQPGLGAEVTAVHVTV